MPLIVHKKVLESCEIGIWKITEPLSYFEDSMDLSLTEREWLLSVNGKRKKEWLSSRFVIKKLFSQNQPLQLTKDEHGKPFMLNRKEFISISHSNDFVAVCMAPTPCGIDIQREVKRIQMIQHKFLSTEELAKLQPLDALKSLHLLWSAKEAIYKAFGRKQISLRQHISVHQPVTKGLGSGELHIENDNLQYDVWFDFLDTYSLAIAKEKKTHGR